MNKDIKGFTIEIIQLSIELNEENNSITSNSTPFHTSKQTSLPKKRTYTKRHQKHNRESQKEDQGFESILYQKANKIEEVVIQNKFSQNAFQIIPYISFLRQNQVKIEKQVYTVRKLCKVKKWNNDEFVRLRVLSLLGESRKTIAHDLEREERLIFSKIQKHQQNLVALESIMGQAMDKIKSQQALVKVEHSAVSRVVKYINQIKDFWKAIKLEEYQTKKSLEPQEYYMENIIDELQQYVPEFLLGIPPEVETLRYINQGFTNNEADQMIECMRLERNSHKRQGSSELNIQTDSSFLLVQNHFL